MKKNFDINGIAVVAEKLDNGFYEAVVGNKIFCIKELDAEDDSEDGEGILPSMLDLLYKIDQELYSEKLPKRSLVITDNIFVTITVGGDRIIEHKINSVRQSKVMDMFMEKFVEFLEDNPQEIEDDCIRSFKELIHSEGFKNILVSIITEIIK